MALSELRPADAQLVPAASSFSLANKVIVVTGGTGILGEAFLAGIVEVGGTVGILGRNAAVAAARAAAINAQGGRALALVTGVLKGALVWLLSNASRFVTSSVICVDGGCSIFGGV